MFTRASTPPNSSLTVPRDRVELRRVREVAAKRARLEPRIANLLRARLRLDASSVDQDDSSATLGERAGDDFADLATARHAGEHSDLAFERARSW